MGYYYRNEDPDRDKKLMGELYCHGDTSQDILTAQPTVGSYTSLLFDSFGALTSVNGIFSRLWSVTAYINSRFFHFIEGLVLRDVDSWYSQSFLVNYLEQDRRSASHSNGCTSETCSSSNSNHNTPSKSHEENTSYSREGLHVNNRPELVGASYAIQGIPRIFHGTVSRVLRTLNGSSDDIGWLQRTPGMTPVEDGTARFLELLEDIKYGKHLLPDSYVYLLIPGLFSNHGPLYFVGTKRFFSKMGLACHIAKIHSEASVEHNAWELKQYVEELYWGSGKRVMMLGHSKGGVDAAAALSIYWSDLEDKVAGLALVQSPYGGTPLASDMLRDDQIADRETRRIMELLICKLIKGDIRSLEDLTYEKRKEFIMKHPMPKNIPLVSFHSEAILAPCVLAMTQIAHAELPWLPLRRLGWDESDYSVPSGCKVPVVMPISAAMAICALHLHLRYGEKSDGLVTCRDAEVPGSIVVRPDQNLDHGWMVYSSNRKRQNEPDASEMCEAILTILVEIGKKMNQE